PAPLRPLIRKAATDPIGLQRDVFNSAPKALFVLLPVFAAILLAFYPKRHYADHLYFSIHVHAFVFAALDLATLTHVVRSPALAMVTALIVLAWIPVYGHLALRRVYGGSNGKTLAKELGIGALYAVASVPVLMGLAMWVAAR